VLATLLAFVITWLLHSYQWFWLRGTLNFTWNDFLFWMILGVLVAANALYEMRRGRIRRLQGKALSWRETLAVVPSTIGVFATICVLWSFWSASSVPQWVSVLQAADVPSSSDVSPVLVLLAVAVIVAIPAVALTQGVIDRTYQFTRSAVMVAVSGVLALCISFPAVYSPLGAVVSTAMTSIKNSDLNRRDFANFERGYYEDLTNVGGFNPELWMLYAAKPGDWEELDHSALVRQTGGLPLVELRPLIKMPYLRALVETNRWGMRDKDYEKTPPPNALRIAVLGASHVFGSGVNNDETFENVLERRLNQEAAGGSHVRYEILNFAVAGYTAVESLATLEDKVFQFHPNYVFYFEHNNAASREMEDITKVIRNRASARYGFLEEIAREAGVDETTDLAVARRKLQPYREDILRDVYQKYAEVTRAKGVPFVWIYLPRVRTEEPPATELRLAQQAGLITLELTGVYDGYDYAPLRLAPWDEHPNAVGHRLIADKLYEVLRNNQDKVPLDLPGNFSAPSQ
jgi:lysophospholipase L1-like esterase